MLVHIITCPHILFTYILCLNGCFFVCLWLHSIRDPNVSPPALETAATLPQPPSEVLGESIDGKNAMYISSDSEVPFEETIPGGAGATNRMDTEKNAFTPEAMLVTGEVLHILR